MNRQLRRASEKSDKKKEKDKERRQRERREARAERAKRRRERPAAKPAPPRPGNRQARVGRWSGFFTVAVIALLIVQEIGPAFSTEPARQLSVAAEYAYGAAYYLFLGHFGALWLLRRGLAQALPAVVSAGMVLALLLEGSKFFLPRLEPDLPMIALALPALLVGGLLGRWLYRNASR